VPEETGEELAIIGSLPQCPSCGHVATKPTVKIVRLERKEGRFVASGTVRMTVCPNCGMTVKAINQIVPIELQALTCACGANDFRFAIRSLKPSAAKRSMEWSFELDVICAACGTTKFAEKILSFLRLKRIKVGLSGIDLQMR
jgi:YgiT-type zinc finger domain-containing protein